MIRHRRPIGRAIRIQRTLVRYGLDEVIDAVHFLRPLRFLFVFAPRKIDRSAPLGVRIRLALEELGPIFVKFGQMLSTRRDLLPADVADELARLLAHVLGKPSDLRRDDGEASSGIAGGGGLDGALCRLQFLLHAGRLATYQQQRSISPPQPGPGVQDHVWQRRQPVQNRGHHATKGQGGEGLAVQRRFWLGRFLQRPGHAGLDGRRGGFR